MNDELRLSVCINETFAVKIELHLKTVLGKANQVRVGNNEAFSTF